MHLQGIDAPDIGIGLQSLGLAVSPDPAGAGAGQHGKCDRQDGCDRPGLVEEPGGEAEPSGEDAGGFPAGLGGLDAGPDIRLKARSFRRLVPPGFQEIGERGMGWHVK